MEKNLFIYWVGGDFSLIAILRKLIFLHSNNNKNYILHFITLNNIHQYIPTIPKIFYGLRPEHQADYIRVNVVCDYGGIWLDSDIIVMDNLDLLFNLVETYNNFMVSDTTSIGNGIFGSKKNEPFILEWKKRVNDILTNTITDVEWGTFGTPLINQILVETNLPINVLSGTDTILPVNWRYMKEEFLVKPYDNYNNIVRETQPFLCLCNFVYREINNISEKNILSSKIPLTYFLNKSFNNLPHLIDYDFVEIGTSDFETEIENASDDTIGLSIEPIKYYLDKLPNKKNVKKLNIAISEDEKSDIPIYYIPDHIIEEHKLPTWFKGCNTINKLHPLHILHGVSHLCNIDKIQTISMTTLFYQNNIRNIKYLKIDTEGHDTMILRSLYDHIKSLPTIFYPKKIKFESNLWSKAVDVDITIYLYTSLGYQVVERGLDTVMIFI